jgi:hypothetical protein
MPDYEVAERHHTCVAAPVEITLAAACETDPMQSPSPTIGPDESLRVRIAVGRLKWRLHDADADIRQGPAERRAPFGDRTQRNQNRSAPLHGVTRIHRKIHKHNLEELGVRDQARRFSVDSDMYSLESRIATKKIRRSRHR